MKLTCFLVLMAWVGLGLRADGASPAIAGTAGNDTIHTPGSAPQPASRPAGTDSVRGTSAPRGRPAAGSPITTARSGNDSRHDGEAHQPHGGPVTVIVYNQPACAGSELALADYVNQQVQDYYQPGYEWGAGLKANTVDWAVFIPYLEQYLVVAPPVGKNAFRQGFIAGFGGSAAATYDYAFRQASQRS